MCSDNLDNCCSSHRNIQPSELSRIIWGRPRTLPRCSTPPLSASRRLTGGDPDYCPDRCYVTDVKVQDNCQELHAASTLWSSQHSLQNFWCEVLHDSFSQLPRMLYSGLRATTCTRWRPSTTATWWPAGCPRGTGTGTPRRLPTCVWSSCSSHPVG